jgi:hypothetical protein
VQDHTFVGAIKSIDRAYRHAGRIAAMHTGDRDRFFTRHTVIQGNDAAAVHTPRHLVLVLASRDATIALDATLGITDKFHSCHLNLL